MSSTTSPDGQREKPSQEVRFEPGDPENPHDWPLWRKLVSFLALIPLDLSVSFGTSGYSPATMKFTEAFGYSSEVGVLGLSLFTLGIALGPLITAPASEYFGRRPIYIVSYGLALPWYVGSALPPNLAAFLIFRFICGFPISVTVATIGGTIADLWRHHETGLPMGVFIWAATGGSSLGFMPWYDVFWAILGISGGCYVLLIATQLYCGETRHSAILRNRAARLRKETGDNTIDVGPEYRRKNFKQVLYNTQTRPFRFMATEPVVQFSALYNGYLYGISFLLNVAFTLVFGRKGHGLNTLQVGLCFLGIFGGTTIFLFTNIFQERYYQSRIKQEGGGNIPEARIRVGEFAGISLFWFAWATYASIHPAVPVLATALWGWSFATLIHMTSQYNEDAYKQYSSSALAALGLVKNLAGAGFPLFGNQMFENEGYQWAGSILAFLALVMVPIPFVLERYGERLRKKSKWAAEHMDDVD